MSEEHRSRTRSNRVRPGGNLRIDRNFAALGIGRIQISSGTSDPRRFEYLNGMLTTLADIGAREVLAALKSGELTLGDLEHADDRKRLHQALADKHARIEMRAAATIVQPLTVKERPLWTTLDDAIASMRTRRGNLLATGSQRRYYTSVNALRSRRLPELGDDATINALSEVNWVLLQTRWDRSTADWNHMRRMLSAVLTRVCGSTNREFRQTVLENIPLATERPRIPDITPALLWRILDAMPEHARPCFVVLVITGMRLGEYLTTRPSDIMPYNKRIDVPGTKTIGSLRTVSVDERFWPWVETAVPAPLGRGWLHKYWSRACVQVGVGRRVPHPHKPGKLIYVGPRIHDLRHCFGQWATDMGAPEKAVQAVLGHVNPATTRRYTQTKDASIAATKLADALGEWQPFERVRQDDTSTG